MGDNMDTKIIVHDSLMGTGKSSKMIAHINNSEESTRWIVVAPFLSECHRYAGTTLDPQSGDRQLPLKNSNGKVIYNGTGCNASGRRFHHPTTSSGSKVKHIFSLVERGLDIVTTHAALKMFTPSTINAIRDAGYSLVIDESLEVIRPHAIKQHQRNILIDAGAVYVDKEGLLRWQEGRYAIDSSEYKDSSGFSWEQRVKALCDNGSLILVEDDKGSKNLFMWEYPVDFLRAFNSIDILTYMFEGSLFEKYFKYHNMPYSIERGVIHIPDRELISIVDNPRMNRIGNRENIFSASDSRKVNTKSAVARDVRLNLENFFGRDTYGKSSYEDRMWTCLKDSRNEFKGKGYTKQYVPHNTKAVNDYRNVSHLAYVYNVYMHPDPLLYMHKRGEDYVPDTEVYAISELLQWVYRSRVRENSPISIYIPSQRMRDMLDSWINYYGRY